ncbi:hypothetical protein LCGC14_1824890 [marine sediment metagenome]|uniref:Uncharacterized protein n=1 Tax=marine sediment metagenome TaxID=412755 RepID=A0A0F9GI06_9ZZZZ
MNEKNENENVHVYPMKDTTKLIISHGNELPPLPPVRVDISGDIDAPERFWELRSGEYDLKKCHVLVDASSICLVVNEHDPFTKGTVVGKLQLDSECTMWGINNEKVEYDNLSLAKLVKNNQFLFPDKKEWRSLYSSLSNFDANISVNLKNIQATSGDMEKARKVTVKNNLPENFKLKTRLYGQPRETYVVDLGAVVIGQSVSFYLDSSQLAFRLSEMRDQLLQKHCEVFVKSIVIIKQ